MDDHHARHELPNTIRVPSVLPRVNPSILDYGLSSGDPQGYILHRFFGGVIPDTPPAIPDGACESLNGSVIGWHYFSKGDT